MGNPYEKVGVAPEETTLTKTPGPISDEDISNELNVKLSGNEKIVSPAVQEQMNIAVKKFENLAKTTPEQIMALSEDDKKKFFEDFSIITASLAVIGVVGTVFLAYQGLAGQFKDVIQLTGAQGLAIAGGLVGTLGAISNYIREKWNKGEIA